MTATNVGRTKVVLASYWVTEESGGPGVAAAGFARELARLGADVTLVALESQGGTWLVDDGTAAAEGYRLMKIAPAAFPVRVARMAVALRQVVESSPEPSVIWANGIWGPQSLAACVAAKRSGAPFVIRPAGSLGHAALGRKRLKKWLYYRLVESRVSRRAAAVHCLTTREVDELPPELAPKAFVVPSGVELAAGTPVERDPNLLGVLARIHPIKNHALALDAVEALIDGGRDVRLEFAGSTSDPACERTLRQRVDGSPRLRGRVRFLGHVTRAHLSETVGRWSAALLLSDQENFGHAVITAAALGVPTVVSTGVGLGPDLERAGAGLVARPGEVAKAVERLLEQGAVTNAEAARAFALRFGWEACARELLDRLGAIAATPVVFGRAERLR